MDFDKLKKAAKETFRIVSSKTDEKNETYTENGEAEQTADTKENVMEQTQRIDLKNVLDLFKKKISSTDDTEQAAQGLNAEPDTENDTESYIPDQTDVDFTPTDIESDKNTASSTAAVNEFNALNSRLESIDTALSRVCEDAKNGYAALNEAISELSENISELRAKTESADKQNNVLTDTIIARLNNTDKKLNNIANSLTGIPKLGDSIFDLKNSQINTKNSLGELEASFYKLKKKLSMSMLIISILTALIAVLEIINLLS